MADPLSTLASLIAIVQLSSKIVSVCYEYRSTAKKASKQQKQLTDEVKSLRDALEGLISLADREDSSGAACLPMLDALSRENGPFEEVKWELQSLEAKLLPASGWKAVSNVLKWPLAEPEVTKSLARLNRLKTAVLLALTTDQTAVTLSIQTGLHTVETQTERLTKDFESMQKREERQRVINWLSAPDPSVDQNIARAKRHEGTGLWLINSEKFLLWKSISGCVLWINGIPGCGKTILSSHVVDYITQFRQSSNAIGIAYYYFDVNNHQQQLPEDFLRSTIAQLSSQSSQIMKQLCEYHRRACSGTIDHGDRKASISDLLALFQSSLDFFGTTFLVLDALDECKSKENLLDLIEQITKMQDDKLNLLVTSRTEKDIKSRMEDLDAVSIDLQGAMIEVDIRTYVDQTLKTDPRLNKWNEGLRSEIRDVLLEGAQGMFRWVACQFDVIRQCIKPQAVKKALRSLPRSLTETYDNIVVSIKADYLDDARKVLQFLAFCGRPVQLAEIAEVLAVDWDNGPEFDPANRLPDVRDILTICSGLITVTEASNVSPGLEEVRLAHSTVKEYLTAPSIPVGSTPRQTITFDEKVSHNLIARTCLAYLLYFDVDHTFAPDDNESYPLAQYAAEYWIQHYCAANDKDGLQIQVLQLFEDDSGCFDNWRKIHNIDKPWTYSNTSKSSPMAPPLYYASLIGLDSIVLRLLQNGADVNGKGGILGSAITAATYKGHVSVVRTLLENGSNPNFRWGKMCSPLIAACFTGQEEIVILLLESGADTGLSDYSTGHPLFVAAGCGHENVVRQLLDSGADLNEYNPKKGTALNAAAMGGHESVCKLLVERGADIRSRRSRIQYTVEEAAHRGFVGIVNFFLAQGIDPTPKILASAAKGNLHGVVEQLIGQGISVKNTLRLAAEGGSLTIVQQLLDAGADVNYHNDHDRAALVAAAASGHDSVVLMLLDHKADINAQGAYWGTPLHAAACNGHSYIVRLLLEHTPPADVNARGGLHTNAAYYGTVLQNAVRSGKLTLVELLLDAGADINAHDEWSGFALETAASGAHHGIVRLLLRKGADVNMNVGRFGSALHGAAASGDFAILCELLDHGANPKALGGDYVTVLEAAAHIGHVDMVCLLLKLGAEPDLHGTSDQARGYRSTGALGIAARHGSGTIVNQLLEAGADFNLTNGYSFKSPIEEAAAAGQLEVMSIFIDRGASIKSTNILQHAIPSHWSPDDNFEMVNFLLDNGADPNGILDDKESLLPLQLAAREGRKSVVRALLEHGADVDRQNDEGWTALHEAAKMGIDEVVRFLVDDYNADTNKKLINGSVALHLAAQANHIRCVQALLDRGQNVNVTNSDGRTALHIAADNGCVEIVQFLLERDADVTIQDSRAGMTAMDIAEFNLSPDVMRSNGAKEIIKALGSFASSIRS